MELKKRTTKKVENLFTKEQILNSKKYIHMKDLIEVLLLDSKTYTNMEVDKLIEGFKKGKVK